MDTIGICLPLTSRQSSTEQLEERWKGLTGQKFAANTRVYIAVDSDDEYYQDKEMPFFSDVFGVDVCRGPWRVDCSVRRPPLLEMYATLMDMALEDGCLYFVMWGDDITPEESTAKNWLPQVEKAFAHISATHGTPYGLGVVALNDVTSPSFPTFPVLHRAHHDAFGAFIDTSVFKNTDWDPYVYELYRPFGLAVFAEEIKIRNNIGGTALCPRYEKQHADWKGRYLKEHIDKLGQILASKGVAVAAIKKTTVAVVVPTYRVDLGLIARIIEMKAMDGFSVRTYVICDNVALDKHTKQRLESFEQLYPDVRVRFNAENLGASATRNRGLDEATEEWVVFIDDDIDVSALKQNGATHDNILFQYCARIKEDGGNAGGFVGVTGFPDVTTTMQAAVLRSGIMYFWGIANAMSSPPWGVTANLCLRRTGCRFHTDFIKTGGGEDIAICLDTVAETGLPLLAAPKASAFHPWWDNGTFKAYRFYLWTQGDGLLIDKYPHLAYYTFPNVIEWSLFSACCGVQSVLFGMGSQQWLPLFLTWLWVVEMGFDLYRTVTKNTQSPLPGGTLKCALCTTWVRNHVEFGHLWVQLKRGRLRNLCRRFDWFCGKEPGAVASTHKNHFGYNAAVFLPLLMFWAMGYFLETN